LRLDLCKKGIIVSHAPKILPVHGVKISPTGIQLYLNRNEVQTAMNREIVI
jgi:hypothetical protein